MTTILLAAYVTGLPVAMAQEMPAEYKTVLETLGKPGDYKANVLKVNIARNDVKVIVDGVATPAPL